MSSRVELYHFIEVPLTTSFGGIPEEPLEWFWTSGDIPVEYLGNTYLTSTLGRTESEVKSGMDRANIQVKMDLWHEMGRRWLTEAPDHTVTLTVFEIEEGETSVGWKGRLMSIKPSSKEIVLVFESVFTSLRRPGLRARYQRSCRHMLYGSGCGLNKANFQSSGTVTSVVGNVVTVPEAASLPDGKLNGGIIEAPDGSMRFIMSHSGSQLNLMKPFTHLAKMITEDGYGLSYGKYYGSVSVKLYPGCNRSRAVCDDTFDNLLNYGGFDWIPTKNPFGGSSII